MDKLDVFQVLCTHVPMTFNDELLPIGIKIWSRLVRKILPITEMQP